MKYHYIAVYFFLFAMFTPLAAHHTGGLPDDDGDEATPAATPAAAVHPAISGAPGFSEKPGSFVPLDLPFVNDSGVTVRLGDVLKGPTILSILYYHCHNACSLLLTGMANVLQSDSSTTAPNVITMTVDEHESPADARAAKTIAFQILGGRFPSDHWHFLTGPAASIQKVTEAVGFHYVKNGDDFDHPLGLIILSPQGKVVRYVLGTDFLPMDLTISLMEASSGTVQPTIARVLRACFSFDPKSHRFVFNTLRVSATVIICLLGVFIAYLIISGRKRRARSAH